MPTCEIIMYTLIPALTVLEQMMYNMWCYGSLFR